MAMQEAISSLYCWDYKRGCKFASVDNPHSVGQHNKAEHLSFIHLTFTKHQLYVCSH